MAGARDRERRERVRGRKLIGSTTRLFAHASIHLPDPAAVLAALRSRIRSPACQYKASHLLRDKHRAVLAWFLGPRGPVLGHGHVFLLDNENFVRKQFVEVFGFDPPDLAAANDVLRVRSVLPTPPGAAEFRAWLLEVLRSRCPVREIRFLDACSHPQIQIADILAGTARAVTESGDAELRPLVAP